MTLKYFSKTALAASLQFADLEERAGPELASSILAAHVFFHGTSDIEYCSKLLES